MERSVWLLCWDWEQVVGVVVLVPVLASVQQFVGIRAFGLSRSLLQTAGAGAGESLKNGGAWTNTRGESETEN
jgi:hypothetical protein